MNINKWMIYKAIWLTILLSIVLCVSSCTKKEKRKKPIKKTGLTELTRQILFNPLEIQDYQGALTYIHSVPSKSLSGEEDVLHGLAHIYLGEVYEVVATMLSGMQLDLYYGSTDPDHGEKFPIINKDEAKNINNKLSFWMGVDAFTVYGEKEAKVLLSSTKSDPLYDLKQNIIRSFTSSRENYKDQTFLNFDGEPGVLGKHMLILEKIIEAEALFKKQKYYNVLTFIDKEGLFNKNIFSDHTYVMYYSPAPFKLAALSHYKLGINALEDGIQGGFATKDSIGYKLIALMNMGEKYHYFEDDKKLSALWKNYEQFFVTQSELVKSFVETGKMPYCLDWILFEDAVHNIMKTPFPNELRLLDDKTDRTLGIMKKLIIGNNSSIQQNEIHQVLMEFYKKPNRMDDYPTLVSGFVSALNRSEFTGSEKKMIQEITENLVFTVARSAGSWQRNRPAFLISLYGTLRWHGGRLPDCNGFLIDMSSLDERLSSMQEISALFTQSLIK